MIAASFKAALLVVDLQEDFCPPNGSLAVPSGRDTIPTINALLSLPGFALRVATKDWHPHDHISFAANHPDKKPFADSVPMSNPLNPRDEIVTRLWPIHCVQGTAGAELVPQLDPNKTIDRVVEKGNNNGVEMYSAFCAPFRNPAGACDSGLADALRREDITHVFVVGLAADYCVANTAIDAAAQGFVTYVVEEGTRPVDAEAWERGGRRDVEAKGVKMIHMDGPEVRRVSGEKRVMA